MTEERHYYKPTDTSIELIDGDIILVRFGRATATLEENTAETHWVQATYKNIMDDLKTPAYVLLDFTTIDNSEYNSDESNKIYLEILRDERLKKIAIFGLHTGWELFINIFKFYVKNKIHTFNTEAQAKLWLSEQRIDEQRTNAATDK